MQYLTVGIVGALSFCLIFLYLNSSTTVVTTDLFSETTLYDATADISTDTLVYPGDPALEIESISSVDDEKFSLSKISMSNHIGTHLDFPSHVISGGKTSSSYSLAQLSGIGTVFAVPDEMVTVSKDFLLEKSIKKGAIVFFKTSNRKLRRNKTLSEKYVYIEPEAAELLVERGVSIVGVDYISVDPVSDEGLSAHNILLKNDVLIVENLVLDEIPQGECFIQIAPLKIPNMDGLPARVLIRKKK